MNEATTTAVFSAQVIEYPNLLLALAGIGVFAIFEHIFMVGKYFGGRQKKSK